MVEDMLSPAAFVRDEELVEMLLREACQGSERGSERQLWRVARSRGPADHAFSVRSVNL